MPKKVRGMFVYNNRIIDSLGCDAPEIEQDLSTVFSEFGFACRRVEIEVWWIYFLIIKEIAKLPEEYIKLHNEILAVDEFLSQITDFDDDDFAKIVELEKYISDENKVYEVFLADKLRKHGLETLVKYIHLGCSDEEMDKCAQAFTIRDGKDFLTSELRSLSEQIARRTDYLKELMRCECEENNSCISEIRTCLFAWRERISKCCEALEELTVALEFSGATKDFSTFEMIRKDSNGVEVELNWRELCENFIERKLGCKYVCRPIQLENADSVYQILDAIRSVNYTLKFLYEWMKKNSKMLYNSSTREDVSFNYDCVLYNIDISNSMIIKAVNNLVDESYSMDLIVYTQMGLIIGYCMKGIKQLSEFISKIDINYEEAQQKSSFNGYSLIHCIRVVLRLNELVDEEKKLDYLESEGEISIRILNEFIESLDISTKDKQMLLAHN